MITQPGSVATEANGARTDFPIEARGLRKTFETRGGHLTVLEDVELELGAGESVAIMGPSGSGKSTLLHILGTLERPSAGTVRLAGRDPFAMSASQLAGFRNAQLGFVFQDHHLLPQCSALENVLIPSLVRTGNRAEAAERARGLLERVGLGERLDYRPSDLSGGERQRVAIARALMNAPKILLCDEPTGNLDRTTGDAVGACFLDAQRGENVALVVVTHDARFAERFDRVLELSAGRLVRPGAAEH